MRKLSFFEKFLVLFGKNYWQMSDGELEQVASKYHIGEYGIPGTFGPRVSRKNLIEQLVYRDRFINAFVSIAISLLAILISLIAVFRH